MENLKLFLVDDDKYSLNLYSQQLKIIGYQDIQLFDAGTECLDELYQKPDIIFLDHEMDNMTGFEVLKKIRRISSSVFVVMLSGQQSIATAVEALKFGAFDYLIKTEVDATRLQDVIDRILHYRALVKAKKPSFLKSVLKFI